MFRKYSKEEHEADMNKIRDKFAAEDARIKIMLDKLEDQIATGFIENEFVENFITSVKGRFLAGIPLSDKQNAKLEELFENY